MSRERMCKTDSHGGARWMLRCVRFLYDRLRERLRNRPPGKGVDGNVLHKSEPMQKGCEKNVAQCRRPMGGRGVEHSIAVYITGRA